MSQKEDSQIFKVSVTAGSSEESQLLFKLAELLSAGQTLLPCGAEKEEESLKLSLSKDEVGIIKVDMSVSDSRRGLRIPASTISFDLSSPRKAFHDAQVITFLFKGHKVKLVIKAEMLGFISRIKYLFDIEMPE